MHNLAEILEEELEGAVEVKDKKSLHRYITLLTDNIAEKESTERQFLEIKHEIQMLAETMKLGFENVNKRFEDMNNRFEDMNKKINILIWVISLWMTLFTGISVFLKIFH